MTTEEALNLLCGVVPDGILHWNEFRSRGEPPPRLIGVDLSGIVIEGAKLDGVDLTSANLSGATLREVNLTGANLYRAVLVGTDLTGSNLLAARFEQADLTRASLTKADATHASFVKANVFKTKFHKTQLHSTRWAEVKSLPYAEDLVTTAIAAAQPAEWVEEAKLNYFQRYCSWEILRAFGRLPLFGVSWVTLLSLLTYLYAMSWYNGQVRNLKGLTETAAHKAERAHLGPVGRLADATGDHLHELPMPSLIWLTLGSTVSLAFASAIYSLWCPSRVKEFSRDVWCDQLSRPLLHYLPAVWWYPIPRAICGFCYFFGGITAGIIVIPVKIFNAASYIAHNV